MLKAIEDGKINQEIESSAYLYQKKIESGEIKIVGVNIFADEEEDENDIENFEVPPEVEEEQIKRLLLVKKERDEGKVKKSLEELERAAKDRDGIFEAVINAVENYATIGEITNSLKKVFGTYRFIYQEV
jgi:methylmalonyl-CoA mutase N-terminal domain/subunit